MCGFTEEKTKRIHEIFANTRADKRTVLLSYETSEIFGLIGVEAPKTKLATSSLEASLMAEQIGFPVVMKIVSPQIMHKSDCGGVLIGVKNADEAAAGFDTIMNNARTRGPTGAILKGVEIQQMVDFKNK